MRRVSLVGVVLGLASASAVQPAAAVAPNPLLSVLHGTDAAPALGHSVGLVTSAIFHDPTVSAPKLPSVGAAVGTALSSTTGSVVADVLPNGLDTTALLQVRGADGLWSTVSRTALGNATEPSPVLFDVGALLPGQDYEFRIVATNADGGDRSTEAVVTTPIEAPARVSGRGGDDEDGDSDDDDSDDDDKPNPTPTPTLTPIPKPTPTPTSTPTPTPSAAPAPTPPTAPADGPIAAPAPVQGATVVLRPSRGTVRYRVPGSSTSFEVTGATSIPTSSIIDTTNGAVDLASAVNGAEQRGRFHGGEFRVKQVKRTGMTRLHLTGALDCSTSRSEATRSSSAAAATRSAAKKKRRHVWGEDKNGRFETHGRNSVATVRGTRWLTTDTCRSTIVRVFEGAVSVSPRRGTRKAVLVRAGERHVTRSKG